MVQILQLNLDAVFKVSAYFVRLIKLELTMRLRGLYVKQADNSIEQPIDDIECVDFKILVSWLWFLTITILLLLPFWVYNSVNRRNFMEQRPADITS